MYHLHWNLEDTLEYEFWKHAHTGNDICKRHGKFVLAPRIRRNVTMPFGCHFLVITCGHLLICTEIDSESPESEGKGRHKPVKLGTEPLPTFPRSKEGCKAYAQFVSVLFRFVNKEKFKAVDRQGSKTTKGCHAKRKSYI